MDYANKRGIRTKSNLGPKKTMGNRLTKKVLGIIPARGNSKAVHRKNMKLLGTKPLIVWTIEKAQKSKLLNRLVLSTDSEEIAEIGKKYDVEVPFLRPAELAEDSTPTTEVIKHCLVYLRKTENYMPDVVVILQPTTPFRRTQDIDKAISLYLRHDVSAVVSVSKVPAHYSPEWQLVINSNGMLTTLEEKELSTLKPNRQLLRDTYYRNGEIYVTNPENPVLKNTIYGNTVLALITENKVNIDTARDFQYAEFLVNLNANCKTLKCHRGSHNDSVFS